MAFFSFKNLEAGGFLTLFPNSKKVGPYVFIFEKWFLGGVFCTSRVKFPGKYLPID